VEKVIALGNSAEVVFNQIDKSKKVENNEVDIETFQSFIE
jgi:hypothetical protein